jgi:hypothetical protein
MTVDEFVPRSDTQLLDEYRKLCRDYGYPDGAPIEVLLAHDYCQGAQVLELIPELEERKREVLRHLVARGVSR